MSLIFGLWLLFAFVRSSQDILSGSLLENSKELIGQRLELKELADMLQDQRIAQPGMSLLLVFWSTTCAPCLEELPQLSAKPDVVVVPINTDRKDFLVDAERVAKILAPQFRFISDAEGYVQKQFKIKFVPTHVSIDPSGIIQDIRIGKTR
ncbi:MAG: TlpA family protein disulfide reductase [Bdellovibrionales bacterium]|nr:TlpA family protein disulfide reductase [Bdellovibrionales bacterium]